MQKKKIFITGASGCIGHYLIDHLINEANFELHLLVRDPERLRFQWQNKDNIHLHKGDIDNIDRLSDILKSVDFLVHIATNWDNSPTAFRINVEKTFKLFELLDPQKIKKIVYFSTASILGQETKPTLAAKEHGTGYVKSKYETYEKIQTHSLKNKIVTLFPTLVFGGDKTHPYSHISQGIDPTNWLFKLLRFMYIDSKFHFMHAYDIAAITKKVLLEDGLSGFYVLGQKVITGKNAIKTITQVFKITTPFQIKVPITFILFLAKIFRIHIDPWTLHCIKNPFFNYTCVTPESFELTSKYSTLELILEDLKQEKS